MPILVAPLNKEMKIIKILVDDKLKRHLESLGMTINSIVTVKSGNGNSVICVVKAQRIALDKNIAAKIFVA